MMPPLARCERTFAFLTWARAADASEPTKTSTR